jgi:hypothetical protein
MSGFPDNWVQCHLELIGIARHLPQGRNDGATVNFLLAGLEHPGGDYVKASVHLVAMLAAKLGNVDEVLDDVLKELNGRDW